MLQITSNWHLAKRRHPPESGLLTSSTPQTLPKKQEALFREVLRLLEDQGIAFALAGAFALQQHTGICRDTKDLDIFLPAEEASVALACLAKDGLECEVRDPVWLAKAHRDGYFVDLIAGMSNAVITVDASWIRHSQPSVVLGVATRLLAAEELVASKLFVTRRERFDGADIAHTILRLRGNLTGTASSNAWVSIGKCCYGRFCCSGTFTQATATMSLAACGKT